ncbi:hypothetical protein VP01_663g7 [Puccinia sorghi]|uniref:Uncharacterized protein n=1 Tax=Puccinia sorghi TaxID=27349 RepID=A0A0L6UH62_9BASI|nr:hypothetical protein VP01_663g7 [Puccinia sorghi]
MTTVSIFLIGAVARTPCTSDLCSTTIRLTRNISVLPQIRNPYSRTGGNYTCRFYEEKWNVQYSFQQQHTEAKEEQQNKLVGLYKQESAISQFRDCLWGPEIFLATEQEVIKLLDAITYQYKQLSTQLRELTGEEGLSTLASSKSLDSQVVESKLLLLLWEAKYGLFMQVVHIQSKKRPNTDSKLIGARLGTKLKERIYKEIQSRRPIVSKNIAAYNCGLSLNIRNIRQIPTRPLILEQWVVLSLKGPLGNGSKCAGGHPGFFDTPASTGGISAFGTRDVGQLGGCKCFFFGITVLQECHLELSDDHLDAVPMSVFSRKHKYKLILRELRNQLNTHAAIMEEWLSRIYWLWGCCQPQENQGYKNEWDEMMMTKMMRQVNWSWQWNLMKLVMKIQR